jgi:hypothetical protein
MSHSDNFTRRFLLKALAAAPAVSRIPRIVVALIIACGASAVSVDSCASDQSSADWQFNSDDLPLLTTDVPAIPVSATEHSSPVAEHVPRPDGPSLHVLFGRNTTLGQSTPAWEAIFENPRVFGQFGVEFTYLNQGYLGPSHAAINDPLPQPQHYRDAYAMLIDYRTPTLARCRLRAAAGLEAYFDTTATVVKYLYQDRHGVGLQASLSGQCQLLSRWAIEFAATHSVDIASYDSTAMMLGLVYTPSDHAFTALSRLAWDADHYTYIDFTFGSAVINSFRSHLEGGTAEWLTFGVALKAPLAIEVSLLNEDVSIAMERRGIAVQLVAHHEFAAGRVQFFAGLGLEYARTEEYPGLVFSDDHADFTKVNVLLSYGIRIPVSGRFSLLLKLGRVASSSGKYDTDIISGGFAYRFGTVSRR